MFAGVPVRHGDRMAPRLQRLSVLRPVGAERPAAVGGVALRRGRHGQLVRQGGVRQTPSLLITHLCLLAK